MSPGISSTASIGDQDFNLTVKRYNIPLSGQGKQKQVSNFYRSQGSVPAGNFYSLNLLSSVPKQTKFIIESIKAQAMLTTSAGVAKAINYIKGTLVLAGNANAGLSPFPATSTHQQYSTIDFLSDNNSNTATFEGPMYVTADPNSLISFSVVIYAAIALNDVADAQAEIHWVPVI